MKNKVKSLVVLGGAALLLGSALQVNAEDQPVQVGVYFTPMHFEFDGKEMSPPEDQSSFLYKDTTYVPLRFVSYALNKKVSWDADTYTVTVSDPASSLERQQIEEYNLNRIVRNPKQKDSNALTTEITSIEVYASQVKYVFDGSTKNSDEGKPGLLYKDTLYVPIRFLAESLGKEISFDPHTYTVAAKQSANSQNPSTVPNPASSTPAPASTAAPTTTPASTSTTSGGGAAGGSSSSSVSKPSYDSLIQSAESEISALQSKAESTFNSLLTQYKAAQTDDEKAALIAKGLTTVASFDSQFESIMSNLSAKLTANGYSDAVVATYRSQYNALKAAKQKELLSSN